MNPILIIVGATTLVGIVGFSMYSMSSPAISDESKKALANADASARANLSGAVPPEWLTNKSPEQTGGKKQKTKKTYYKKNKNAKNKNAKNTKRK